MKKIILLIALVLTVGGCYDYNELNDLAIVAGIGIDYEDQEYEVTFEIISTKKEGEQAGSTSTYTVSAKASTVAEAFAKNGSKMDKVAYYDHIEVVIISENVAKEALRDVSEYLIRGSKIRNEFILAIVKEKSAKEIIAASTKEKPVASTFMVNLLRYSANSDSAGFFEPFTKTLGKILTQGEDAMLPLFSINEKKIELEGLALFKGFEFKKELNNKEASYTNLLTNFPARTVFFEKTCQNGKKTVISIYDAKLEIKPNNDNVIVSGIINARINEDNCGYDLRKEESYQELQKEFNKIISQKLNDTVTIFKAAESDGLGIGKKYYNTYRQKFYDKWLNQDFIYDLNLKINKKGLIFEVK